MSDNLNNDNLGEENLELLEQAPKLTILYQDEHLVAVNKPSGLFVHRSFMDRDEKYFALQLVRDMVGQYVYPLHRLDRPTSGVLLFGLSEDVARKMGQAFTDKSIQKTYYAITRGHLVDSGQVDYALKEKLDKLGDKNVNPDKPAQNAITDYKSIAIATLPIALGKYPSIRYSLIQLKPHSGRRHQIRRHLAHLRHPIIGDINYGDNKQNPFFAKNFGFKRLMLHAQKLEFTHPVTAEPVVIEAAFDSDWLALFDQFGWTI
ncbi:tRNA pseudouridine(65) synthase TruC [Thalassomonas sp. M1454]|uniref:tRNA pseudouridine(65) synthase TruC n=1 Tax=Thalassomonas sp. M1454 TaxID=2594477 RepID=UPI00117C1C7B|nr:tRNA pseudouridine(65) synthase TruC [Thalassomonas sp. M1454]TRX56392.1 tRNA pseudouridine(65) synthase TruC [Thalassomonas sp. M1454]